MAFCPRCRAEYRKEITRCPTCDRELVDEQELPPKLTDAQVVAALEEDKEELVTVAEGTLQGLRPVQEQLIETGIPAALRKSEEMMTEAGRFLRLEVLVRQRDAEQAILMVREALQGELSEEMLEGIARLQAVPGAAGDAGEGEGEDPFDEAEPGKEGEEGEEGALACPACGSTEPLVDGECPECGLFLGSGDE
jgi:hypothetical protein